MDKERLIKDLQKFYEKYRYIPLSHGKYQELYSGEYYRKNFGSWNKALIAAGLTPYQTVSLTECKCEQCGKELKRKPHQLNHPKRKTDHRFCCQSCACTYNQTHKTKGYRRSKLESYIERQLTKDYPNLEIHFNRKDTINSELDFYIPSLKIAIELNGIFHYVPIYSEKQFIQIQNNDKKKSQICFEQGIELFVIDVSELSHFKESNAKPYYNIVKNIIDKKLVESEEIESSPSQCRCDVLPLSL